MSTPRHWSSLLGLGSCPNLLGGLRIGPPQAACHHSSAGKTLVSIVANCDDNRAGLSETAKRPESEEPVETARATGCSRFRDVVMFARERVRS